MLNQECGLSKNERSRHRLGTELPILLSQVAQSEMRKLLPTTQSLVVLTVATLPSRLTRSSLSHVTATEKPTQVKGAL